MTEEMKQKGFAMFRGAEDVDPVAHQFGKIKTGAKTLDDAVLKLGTYKRVNPRLGDKGTVLQAIHSGDYEMMREISNFFFKTSGIY